MKPIGSYLVKVPTIVKVAQNPMLNLILSVLVLGKVQAEVSQTRYDDYRFIWGVPPGLADQFDATAIVKSLRISKWNPENHNLHSEEVVVVSSATIPSGTHLITMTPSTEQIRGSIPHYTMVKDQNYLLIGVKPKNGYIPFTDLICRTGADGKMLFRSIFPRTDVDQVEAINVFPTNATQMDMSASPPDRLMEALVDCLPGESADDTIRTTLFLGRMNPNPVVFATEQYLTNPNSLTERIKQTADDSPTYQKALTYNILADWRVKDSQYPYLQSLLECISFPNAFTDKRIELKADTDYINQSNMKAKITFTHFFEAASTCNSSYLLDYIQRFIEPTSEPSLASIQSLAQHLLKVQSEKLQTSIYSLLEGRLANNRIYPKGINDQNSNAAVWQNKAACLKFWKDAVEGNWILNGTLNSKHDTN